MVSLDDDLDDVPSFVISGWDSREDVGAGVFAVHYPDGTIRIEHTCHRTRDGLTIVCAPKLAFDHTRSGGLGHLTITPSILCGDCGLHGHIVDGTWRPC